MIVVAIGGTLAALGVFGLVDQVRQGSRATVETIAVCALAFGIGLGLIGAGFS